MSKAAIRKSLVILTGFCAVVDPVGRLEGFIEVINGQEIMELGSNNLFKDLADKRVVRDWLMVAVCQVQTHLFPDRGNRGSFQANGC